MVNSAKTMGLDGGCQEKVGSRQLAVSSLLFVVPGHINEK